jgi:hypothetical protein
MKETGTTCFEDGVEKRDEKISSKGLFTDVLMNPLTLLEPLCPLSLVHPSLKEKKKDGEKVVCDE